MIRFTTNQSIMGDDDTAEYTFSLSAENDEALIEELERAEQGGRLNEQIQNYLRLGHSVHLAATFQTSQESLRSLMSPLDQRIDTLTDTVNTLLKGAQGSSTKGEIGEQIVIGHLSSAYTGTKGDQFRSKGDEGHSMDIEATMMIETSSGVTEPIPALIEAKLYETTVGQQEVDKFWKDLEGNHHKFGLFVSLNNSIANQPQCITLEVRNGKYGILVYNESQNQMRHLVAYAMMREIARLTLMGKQIKTGENDVLTTLVNDLSVDLKVFSDTTSLLGKIEQSASSILVATAKNIATIHSSTGSLRTAIEQGIARMDANIKRASGELSVDGLKQLAWNNDIWVPTVGKMPDRFLHIFTAMRETMLAIHELAPMSIDPETEKPTIIFKKGDDITITMEAQSNKLQITFEYDGEIPEKIPGSIKKGKAVIDIPQKADAIGNINWPVLGELMMSAVD